MTEYKPLKDLWQGEPIEVELEGWTHNPYKIFYVAEFKFAYKNNNCEYDWGGLEIARAKLYVPEPKMVEAWPALIQLQDGKIVPDRFFTSEEKAKEYYNKKDNKGIWTYLGLLTAYPAVMIPKSEGE